MGGIAASEAAPDVTGVPLAIAAAAAALADAIDWPPPWYMVAWDDGRGGLHLQPVDGSRRDACARAASLLLGRVRQVWVVALAAPAAEPELVMMLRRAEGLAQGLL